MTVIRRAPGTRKPHRIIFGVKVKLGFDKSAGNMH